MADHLRLTRNTLSVVGALLTTASALVFLAAVAADAAGLHTTPYLGIVFFLLLPAAFVVGLALIPLGAWLEGRRRAAGRPPSAVRWPRIDLDDPAQRHTAVLVLALTIINVVIVAMASYRGVEYMDSVQFCGQVCHTVMQPEFVSHERQAHARVRCVECHVGPGASSFASSKLAGTRRVLATIFGTYPRPIVARADRLLSARDACERCHWADQPYGDRIRRIVEYADDETNTQTVTTLRLHVGGGDRRLGTATGIHSHMNVAHEVEYIAADEGQQTIPYVRMRGRDGVMRVFSAEGERQEPPAAGWRRMGCLDCHNRPSHQIAPTAERAVNEAMADGRIPADLPYVHREAVRVLKGRFPSQQAAADEIARRLRDFFSREQPRAAAARVADIDRAIAAVQEIYARNVFPAMNVEFGTYPAHTGHVDSPGCFRCHDDRHASRDGRRIAQECDSCHAIE